MLLASISLVCAGAVFGAETTPTPQAAIETAFDGSVHPSDLRDWLKILAAEPNHVSSPHDKLNAEWILAKFKSWGWDAHIETFQVLYPTPIDEVA